MTSKLIVNSLAADTGVSTITFADQAKMGNAIFHSTGFTIGDSFLHSTGVNITNINATGVITATKFVGEVSVGSSITFEDNEKAYFGTGTDFSIYHNGSASYLDESGTGGLIVKTDTAFQVFNSAGSQPAFTVTPGGSVDLYHNTTKVLETKAYGMDITGGFVATGDCSIADKITHSGDLNTAIRFPAADTFSVETGGNERFRIASDGQNTIKSGAHDKGLDILPVGNQQETRLRIQAKNSSGTEHTFSFNAKQSANRMDISGTGPICFIGSQNVGVHNAIPTSPLHVGDDVNPHTTKAHLFVGPASGDGQFHLRGGSPTVFFDVSSGGNTKILTDNAALTISNGTLDSNGTELVRITSGGKFGVGTNNPGQLIHTHSGSSSGGLAIQSNGSTNYIAAIQSANSFITGSTAGGLAIRSGNGIDFSGNDGSSVQMRLASGNLTIGDGNLVVASGHGIDFSATSDNSTSGASTASELLDDYEEGSFTPTFVQGYNSITYNANAGFYTKIGNFVSYSIYFSVLSAGGQNAEIRISLPFTTKNQQYQEEGAYIVYDYNFLSSSNDSISNCYIMSGRNYSYLRLFKNHNAASIKGNETLLGTGANNVWLLLKGFLTTA